jgi:hypothetical protein
MATDIMDKDLKGIRNGLWEKAFIEADFQGHWLGRMAEQSRVNQERPWASRQP